MIRLDKYVAMADLGSRKKVRELIQKGEICVNGEPKMDPAIMIEKDNDVVTYRNWILTYHEPIYYMFHKPAGCVTAKKDDLHKTVMDYISPWNQKGLFPVGRLDLDTEGLLLLTNDGEFEHQLMHPDNHATKTYYFLALGTITQEDLQKINDGIFLNTESEKTRPAKLTVNWVKSLTSLQKEQEREYLYIKNPNPNQMVTSGTLKITEGKKHQVKRMLKAIGCYVIYLKRIAINDLMLDPFLEPGAYRELTKEELHLLKFKTDNFKG